MSIEAKSWPEFVGKDASEVETQLKAAGTSNSCLSLIKLFSSIKVTDRISSLKVHPQHEITASTVFVYSSIATIRLSKPRTLVKTMTRTFGLTCLFLFLSVSLQYFIIKDWNKEENDPRQSTIIYIYMCQFTHMIKERERRWMNGTHAFVDQIIRQWRQINLCNIDEFQYDMDICIILRPEQKEEKRHSTSRERNKRTWLSWVRMRKRDLWTRARRFL